MKYTNDKTTKFLLPILSLSIFSIILISSINTYLSISMFEQHMQRDIDTHKINYLQEHKNKVYKKVHLVNNSIKFQINKMENNLKESLKERIETSLIIANDIYTRYKGKIKDKDITKKIMKHLQVIRFNNNRGYYFAYDARTNIIQTHAIKKFIGKDMSNFKDMKGQHLVNLYTKALDKNNIAFSKIYFNKPNDIGKEYPKIVSIARFKPLNLVIGTGEYLDVTEKKIKKYVLSRFKKLTNDTNSYLFFLNLHNINGGDKFATMILNPNRPDLVGKQLNDSYQDAKNKYFRKEFLEGLRKKGEAYTKYWYKKPNTDKPKPKMSYFYLQKDWNWIIASGFYYDDLKLQINEMEKSLEDYTKQTIYDSLFWIFILSLVVIIIATYVSLRIDKIIKKFTDELINKKHELELAQEVAKMGSWSLDLTTKKFKWSNETYKIFEVDKNKHQSTHDIFLEIIHPDDKDMVNKAYIKSLQDQKPYSLTHRLLMKDGRVKWVKEKCETTFDNNGIALISNGAIHDITKEYEKNEELKQKEKLINSQEKLASMGEMIGNIAHQWRQPLSVISTGATGLQLQKEYGMLTDEFFIETCENINKNAQYLSKTIDDFKNFIKGERILKNFNLEENINSFIHLVEGSIKSNNINVILNLEKNINLNGYPNELIQCFINIFNNSKDALNKENIEDKYIFISTFHKNDKIIISIKDNGGGIPENILEKVFDPYFTTKHKSSGTGLGLNMSYRLIVDGMKGLIKAENSTYKYNNNQYNGAKFIIELPLS